MFGVCSVVAMAMVMVVVALGACGVDAMAMCGGEVKEVITLDPAMFFETHCARAGNGSSQPAEYLPVVRGMETEVSIFQQRAALHREGSFENNRG
jgi:hypothetical protein